MTSYEYTVVRLYDVSRAELLRLHEQVWECRMNRGRALLVVFETKLGRTDVVDEHVMTELVRTIYSVRGTFPLQAFVRNCDFDCLRLLTAIAPEARFADASVYVHIPKRAQRFHLMGDESYPGPLYLEDDFWDKLSVMERDGPVAHDAATAQRLGLIPNVLKRGDDVAFSLRLLASKD